MAREIKHPAAYKVRRIKDELLTARPEDMSYAEYRELRRLQQKQLKGRLRNGYIVWKSAARVVMGRDGKPVGVKGESWGPLVGKVPSIEFVD